MLRNNNKPRKNLKYKSIQRPLACQTKLSIHKHDNRAYIELNSIKTNLKLKTELLESEF